MAYGRSTGFKLGSSKMRKHGLKLHSDMKESAVHGAKKAPKASRKSV